MRSLLVAFLCFPFVVVTGQKWNGTYVPDFLPTMLFTISGDQSNLMIELKGQGKTGLKKIGEDRYKLNNVKPAAYIQFSRDSAGNSQFSWHQAVPDVDWVRIDTGKAATDDQSLKKYAGRYRPKNGRDQRPLVFKFSGDSLTCSIGDGPDIALTLLSADEIGYRYGSLQESYRFSQGPDGLYTTMHSRHSGYYVCKQVENPDRSKPLKKHLFTERGRFTHADSLQGTLNSLRRCYDVLFYDLNLVIDPETKSLQGENKIRVLAKSDFQELQIDLADNFLVKQIAHNTTTLTWTRDGDAIFVRFPCLIKTGEKVEFTVSYGGQPQVPDIEHLAGGVIWTKDGNGEHWVESVTQGVGASVLWPCKDHLTDKPDSMHISVTVPANLTEISNGRFLGKTMLPDHLARFDWYVHYPINSYDVVFYIGDYDHYADRHQQGNDSLPIDYYFLKTNKAEAQTLYASVEPALRIYEKAFGPYPFPKDGFKMVEGPYPMEHQSAVSMGQLPGVGQADVDRADLLRRMWHEMAHEWWGNNVTCTDYAEFWIHEAFATYAETLCFGQLEGPSSLRKYAESLVPKNDEPIIGFYGVNDFHEGDMYEKGARMLLTLQQVVGNDSLWFSILRNIQGDFRYGNISTGQIVMKFKEQTHVDYSPVFDQYLKHTRLPELVVTVSDAKDSTRIAYKWIADVPGFDMPVEMQLGSAGIRKLKPTSDWQEISVPRLKHDEPKVDPLKYLLQLSIKKIAPGANGQQLNRGITRSRL